VADAALGFAPEDLDILSAREKSLSPGSVLLVLNKMDMAGEEVIGEHKSLGYPLFPVSAREGWGLAELASGIRDALLSKGSVLCPRPGDLAPNLRQTGLLRTALAELTDLRLDLAQGMPADILSVRLESAVEALDEVTGSSGTEELLDRIFSSFCIGK
jgi:tRNA modification GTPase